MQQLSPSAKRQAWLETGLDDLRKLFKSKGHTVPDNVRVSIGWPRGHHGKGKAIGQCWDALASTDKHHEIFISPALKHGPQILSVMAHELVHATVGTKAGHKAPFKHMAVSVGLEGKMTATTSGPELKAWELAFIASHGPYPGGAVIEGQGRAKQTTRLIKCECEECGYTVRTTRKWIEESGPPRCAHVAHGAMLPADYEGEDDGE